MRIRVAAALLLLLFVVAAWAAQVEPYLIRTSDAAEVSLGELVKASRGVRIVLFGENHYSTKDHQAQLTYIRAMREAGVKIAVAHEMLPWRSQKVLDAYIGWRVGEEALYEEFTSITSPIFFQEASRIYGYCREYGIPVIGLRADSKILYKIFFNGFKSLTKEELKELPGYDPTCKVPKRYARFMEMFAETTPPFNYVGPKDPNTCQFYMGLDSVMAHLMAKYADLHPDTTVIALTGALHAWKHGIPSHLPKHTSASILTIFPSTQSEVNIGYNLTAEDADYVWWHFEE